jgi:hypothetical protein
MLVASAVTLHIISLQQDSRYQTPCKECLQLKGLQQTPYNVKEEKEKYTLK